MSILGALVNGVAVVVCGILGSLIKNRLPKRVCDIIVTGLSLCIIYIGIKGALSGENALIPIISITVGAIIGELIDIDRHLNSFGMLMQKKLGGGDGRFAEGFVTVTLLVCVGAWAITGAMDAGIRGDNSSFYAKTVVDGVSTLILASTLGIGTALGGVALFAYQGGLTVFFAFAGEMLSRHTVNEMTCVGSLLIIAIGLNMLGLTKIKTVNLLPAVLVPPVLCLFL